MPEVLTAEPTLPVGILLAAGRGKRFDPAGLRKKLMQQLPGGDAVVVAASAAAMKAVLARVVAVVRPGDDDVAAVLRAAGCEVMVCQDADEGMAASLAHGVGAVGASCIVALGDMPFVAPSTVQALVSALGEGAAIAAPVFEGRRGNPVAFAASMLSDLLALRGDEGARSLFARHAWRAVEVDDAGILLDIDTPADLPGCSS